MTKILILSDIHGNAHALEKVLQNAPAHDSILCLGDIVGYGARPNECCQMLRERDATCLMGNHDAAVLGQLSTEWFNDIAKAAVEWTKNQLSAENRDWLLSLFPQMVFAQSKIQAVHASLREPLEEYITDERTALATLNLMDEYVCFYGHTHQADCYAVEVEDRNYAELEGPTQYETFVQGGQFKVAANHMYLVNPGSVGQPRDGNPQARAAIYDLETKIIEILAFDYDIQAARNAIIEAGLPRDLGDRLLAGE